MNKILKKTGIIVASTVLVFIIILGLMFKNELLSLASIKKEENGGRLSEQQAIDLLAEVGINYLGIDKLQWTAIYNLTTGTGRIFTHRNTDNIIDFNLTV